MKIEGLYYISYVGEKLITAYPILDTTILNMYDNWFKEQDIGSNAETTIKNKVYATSIHISEGARFPAMKVTYDNGKLTEYLVEYGNHIFYIDAVNPFVVHHKLEAKDMLNF